ncbi:hypothetical protein CEXT_202111 [Caerostris extrusa]|uniref:Ycf15 n=1 Tax=Caerostris extrusa TaxID=172846 RepID=A0AAV4T3I4_CAEEX|nr:hypothetical protein CEXT_202111 [Caerostris extrusa]
MIANWSTTCGPFRPAISPPQTFFFHKFQQPPIQIIHCFAKGRGDKLKRQSPGRNYGRIMWRQGEGFNLPEQIPGDSSLYLSRWLVPLLCVSQREVYRPSDRRGITSVYLDNLTFIWLCLKW